MLRLILPEAPLECGSAVPAVRAVTLLLFTAEDAGSAEVREGEVRGHGRDYRTTRDDRTPCRSGTRRREGGCAVFSDQPSRK